MKSINQCFTQFELKPHQMHWNNKRLDLNTSGGKADSGGRVIGLTLDTQWQSEKSSRVGKKSPSISSLFLLHTPPKSWQQDHPDRPTDRHMDRLGFWGTSDLAGWGPFEASWHTELLHTGPGKGGGGGGAWLRAAGLQPLSLGPVTIIRVNAV